MILDLRDSRRHRGRPSPAETGRKGIGLSLGPFPGRVPDPWKNRIAIDLFWHMSGGVIMAIATAQVQGGELPEHRCQELATLNTYRTRCPVMYAEGLRGIPSKAVDTDWCYGVEFRDDRCKPVMEVAVQACYQQLRDRMFTMVGDGLHTEVPVNG